MLDIHQIIQWRQIMPEMIKPNALETPFDDIYGATYTYENWSKNDNTFKIYDTTKEVTKRTAVNAIIQTQAYGG